MHGAERRSTLCTEDTTWVAERRIEEMTVTGTLPATNAVPAATMRVVGMVGVNKLSMVPPSVVVPARSVVKVNVATLTVAPEAPPAPTPPNCTVDAVGCDDRNVNPAVESALPIDAETNRSAVLSYDTTRVIAPKADGALMVTGTVSVAPTPPAAVTAARGARVAPPRSTSLDPATKLQNTLRGAETPPAVSVMTTENGALLNSVTRPDAELTWIAELGEENVTVLPYVIVLPDTSGTVYVPPNVTDAPTWNVVPVTPLSVFDERTEPLLTGAMLGEIDVTNKGAVTIEISVVAAKPANDACTVATLVGVAGTTVTTPLLNVTRAEGVDRSVRTGVTLRKEPSDRTMDVAMMVLWKSPDPPSAFKTEALPEEAGVRARDSASRRPETTVMLTMVETVSCWNRIRRTPVPVAPTPLGEMRTTLPT